MERSGASASQMDCAIRFDFAEMTTLAVQLAKVNVVSA
jgi:hypothetical protein